MVAKARGRRLTSSQRASALFHLWHNLQDIAAEAEKHMTLAAGTYRMDHFMGKIATLHCELRGWKIPQ